MFQVPKTWPRALGLPVEARASFAFTGDGELWDGGHSHQGRCYGSVEHTFVSSIYVYCAGFFSPHLAFLSFLVWFGLAEFSPSTWNGLPLPL